MRLWHWIVRIFLGRATETEIYDREALRKAHLDKTARNAARGWGSPGSGGLG
jgi:hypothetical protein